jgi:hypothetical protein
MQYTKPIITLDIKGELIAIIIGTCDTCENEINNYKDAFISAKGKIYHANSMCYTN